MRVIVQPVYKYVLKQWSLIFKNSNGITIKKNNEWTTYVYHADQILSKEENIKLFHHASYIEQQFDIHGETTLTLKAIIENIHVKYQLKKKKIL